MDKQLYIRIKEEYINLLRNGYAQIQYEKYFLIYQSQLDTEPDVISLKQQLKAAKHNSQVEKVEINNQNSHGPIKKIVAKQLKSNDTRKAKTKLPNTPRPAKKRVINTTTSDEETPINYYQPQVKFTIKKGQYIGRAKNLVRKVQSLSTPRDVESLLSEIRKLQLTVNELDSVIDICRSIADTELAKRLISNLKSLMDKEQERLDVNTKKYVEQQNRKPRKPFMRIVYTPMGGQNKRF